MNNQGGAIAFDAVINDQNFKSHIDQMKRDIRGLSSTTQTETSKMNDSFSTLAKYAAGFFSVNVAQQFVRQLVNVRGEFQQLEIAFSTMLKSKGAANDLMQQLIHTAATTPFSLMDVANGAKQLLAYGTSAKEVNDTLIRLGNIASGLSIPLGDLVYLYGTTKVQGRLFAQDVRQFMGRGIPLVQELVKQMGKSTDEIYKMVSAGKIGFPEVQKVINSMTDAGGQFYNLMAKQSKSLTGQISNLGDAFDMMLNQIGQSNEGILSSGISGLSALVANYKDVGRVLGAIIVDYGLYKAAIAATTIVQKAHSRMIKQIALERAAAAKEGQAVTVMQAKRIVITKNLTAAQRSLNAAMSENALSIVLVGLTSLYLMYQHVADEIVKVKSAKERLNEVNNSVNSGIDEQAGKIKALIGIVTNANATDEQRHDALTKLKNISPDLVTGYDLQSNSINTLRKNTENYLTVLRQQLAMSAFNDQMTEAYTQLQKVERQLKKTFSEVHPNQDILLDLAYSQGKDLEKAMGGFRGTKTGQALSVFTQLNPAIGAKTELDNLKIAYAQAKDALTGLQNQQDDFVKQVSAGAKTSDDTTKTEISNKEKLSKLLTELSEKQKELNKARADGTKFDSKHIESLQEGVKNLKKQIELIRPGYFSKSRSTKSTTEEDAKEKSVDITPQLDRFRNSLDELKRQAANISTYIDELTKKEASLAGDTSELGIAKLQEVKSRIADAEIDRIRTLKSFLTQIQNYEQERTNIAAYYADIRSGIEKSNLKDKKTALDEATQAEKEANENLINAQIDKKNRLEGLYKEIVGTGRDALKKQLENDQKALANAIKLAGGDMNNDRVIHLLNLVEQDKKALSDFDVSKWQDWASLVGQAGGELAQLPGTLGQIGQVMNTLAQGAQQLGAAIKEAKDGTVTTGDAIAAGASAVASWVNIIASSIKQRKQAEEDYYNSVLSYQNSYNLALIEQIGLQSQMQSNIFSENYLSEIKDKWNESTAALDEYYDAIKKLDEAQVKTGTKKKVNWAAVGSGALSGAAAGATVGSSIPVIGTAIGAVVGGIAGGLIGLFGGKKTVDTFNKLLDEYPDLLNAQGELNKAQAQSLLDSGLLDAKSQAILQHASDLQKAYEDAKKAIDDIIQGLVGDLGNQLRDALVSAFEDGTDAAQGFADAVENVLSNALSNIIFSAVFDQAFKDLTARLEESATSGDNNWIDDFGDFFSQYPDLIKQFNEGMKSAQDQAKQFGLDLFGNSSKSNPNSLEGAIKSVSENTASVIAGQMNAIRINQIESLTIVRTQLLRLTTIADNSRYLMYLMSIDKRLAKAAGDPWRAQGVA